jgi:hemoglobin
MTDRMPPVRPQPGSVADRIGPEAFLTIVDDFYARVEQDELLRPLYPEDLEPGKTHLAQFLAQYFGAGMVYSAHRGHPRLRMRHAPFRITIEAAARWAVLMTDAIEAQGFDDEVEAELLAYVVHATPQMVNELPDEGTLPTSAG